MLRFVLRAPQFDVAIFAEQLRDLSSAGLSIIEALEALGRSSNEASNEVIEKLSAALRKGTHFSGALLEQPLVFPQILVALVQASEVTSDLVQALSAYIDHQRRVTEIWHRIVSATVYPLLLVSVGASVLLFMMFYVVPRFSRVFSELHGDLPWAAAFMVAWATFLTENREIAIGCLAVLGACIAALILYPRTRAKFASVLFEFEPVRRRLIAYFLARWYRTIGLLLAGGIPLSESLRLTLDLLPETLQQRGAAVEGAVRAGFSPAQAFRRAGMTTSIADQLLAAGERSGDLGTILTRIAAFHESEVSRSLELIMRSFEPLLMIFIGLGVGIVVVLMYLPIFELASAIQ